MANPALPRPDMPGPQPVEETKVTSVSAHRASPLLQASGGEVPDRIFKSVMTLCGLAVLGVLVLIVSELISGSGLTRDISNLSAIVNCRNASAGESGGG